MQSETARIAFFGTSDPPAADEAVEIGALTFLLDSEAIRALSWNGVEVVRAINWPVRDQSWITLGQKVNSASLDVEDETARYTLDFSVADGALDCVLTAVFESSGSIRAELTMTARRDFDTNRAGFTLLHPIDGVAGERLEILHSDGSHEISRFPGNISPDQPAMDISGLKHEVDGVAVDIAFGGEIFEMEDQRNWTDASFKTYCCPLVFPFTYRIASGETVRQTLDISIAGVARGKSGTANGQIGFSPGGSIPQITLAVQDGWQPKPGNLKYLTRTGVHRLSFRTSGQDSPDYLKQSANLARVLDVPVDIEIVVPEGKDPEEYFLHVARLLSDAAIEPASILSVPEPYLKSHQPSGPWPKGATPTQCVEAARAVFGAAPVGGGMLTNFTELNRCPPDMEQCDFIGHGTTAIVHAADDRSVCETLEALPQIFESALRLGGGKYYRLGLTSIGMRSNPYGADVAENPDQIRQTMAQYDPRQCGVFAAAFGVGVLHATQDHPVGSLALAAPSGPLGILSQSQPVKRPYFDLNEDAVVYPLFHVVRMAAGMHDKRRLKVTGLAKNVHAVAAGDSQSWLMMIANLGADTASASLPAVAEVRSLDAVTFAEAVRDPDWLVNSEPTQTDVIELEPFEVSFVGAGEART